MIWIFKILCIFGVLFISNYKDANTGTNLQRGHTGESSAVIFVHRMDVDSSDPLLFFHSNHFIMLSTNDERANGTPLAISAETVIQTITESDDPKNLREHLHCLMDSYLLQPEEEIILPKRQVYCSFLTLDEALQMIEGRGV